MVEVEEPYRDSKGHICVSGFSEGFGESVFAGLH